jgi:murein L,D-transpeptidase YafK
MASRKSVAAICGLVLLAFIAVSLPLMVRQMAGPSRGDNTMSDRSVFDRTALMADLRLAGFSLGDAAHIRIFKRERRLEVWLQNRAGRFSRFRDYDICNYSGELGPKLREGDLQAPEGFYRVGLKQLNPNSRHHLAFNLGFPNEYDRAHGRTGSALMIHGGCSSVGCYAMTDEKVDEIYAIVEAALLAGQEAVDIHAFPFVLSQDAFEGLADQRWARFWGNLKEGHDLFEASHVPPKVGISNGDYCFGRDVGGPNCTEIGYWRA